VTLIRASLIALLPACLFAAPVAETTAFVQSREASDDGKLIKAKVKFLKAGTYFVAAGHVVDRDARFQFLEGKRSGMKYFEVRKVEAAKDDAMVEISFPLKGLPPLVKTKPWVGIYEKAEDVPVTTP